MAESFRGIFPVLQTPFTAVGEMDLDGLRRQVDFWMPAQRLVDPGRATPLAADHHESDVPGRCYLARRVFVIVMSVHNRSGPGFERF